jgi:hypothetical protein
MTGMAVSRFIDDQNISAQEDDTTNSTIILPVQNQLSPVQVSSTLAFTVGLVQIIMGILRLELITTYFSDQVKNLKANSEHNELTTLSPDPDYEINFD